MLECTPCDRAYWEFGKGNKNEISKHAEILTDACNRKRVNTLIPTLVQSKSLSFQIPKVVVARNQKTKKLNSSILVLIPVINADKWYVNCRCPFFPFAQWTQWRTVMVQRLFYQCFYRLKTDRVLNIVFKSVQFFFASSCAQFHVQTSGWVEDFKHVHRNYSMLYYDD
jgi:hypothetical protein